MNLKPLRHRKTVVMLVLCMALMFAFSSAVSANSGLDGIGGGQQTQTNEQTGNTNTGGQTDQVVTQPNTSQNQQTQQQQVTQQPTTQQGSDASGAEVIGGLFDGVGVDREASQKANIYLSPLVRGANILFAIILGLTSVAMFLITALDLAYIAVPPLRRFLNPGGDQQAAGGIGGGMMGGGMMGGGIGYSGGMGYSGGRYGGGMMGGGGGQPQGNFLTRWISDEALHAVSTLTMGGGAMGGGGMMGGGMMGGGMMGGGMGYSGGMQQQEQPKTGSVIITYLKKRAFFLIMFGLCSVLFSTLIFTDIGVKAGSWLLERLMGARDNFPQ